MARSLNRAQLIGNLTRDPELRYTPQGTAVCTFGVATNRSWTTDNGEKKEDAEFHRIVAWNKLAELCSQLLTKGRKVFVEGRISSRSWTGQDGTQRNTTEIVIEDMIILDSRRSGEGFEPGEETQSHPEEVSQEPEKVVKTVKDEMPKEKRAVASEDINPDDIPF
jgi:single-strand DNA-binding protein